MKKEEDGKDGKNEKPDPPTPPDPDEEVFASFGITEDTDKANVKKLAAARVLAHRRLNPPKPKDEKPPKNSGWNPMKDGE